MRIYEGSPRQDWEEVLRSVGAYLDERGMRDVVFIETDSGFIVHGVGLEHSAGSGESMGQFKESTLTIPDDDVGRFMDESLARRGAAPGPGAKHYETQLRVIGRYIDEQHPRSIFFFEQDGAYVVRLSQIGQTGPKHELVEFTREDVADLIARAPALRRSATPSATS